MPRVLLLLPAAGYRNEDFLLAAQKLDAEVITAADHCHRLAPLMGMSPILSLPFDQPEIAAEQALVSLGKRGRGAGGGRSWLGARRSTA